MLESIKVLAFTHYLQGPLAAQLLGDLGADVIKVESVSGAFERNWSGMDAYINGESVNFFIGNRSQRSLSINLKTTEGKQIIYELAKNADVVIENFRPSVMERLGFDYELLKKFNPGLVYCECSAYGSGGPYKDLPGQDLQAQAISGYMMQGGRSYDPPMPVGTAIVDEHAAVLASMGILAALYSKKKTGVGRKVECSLLDAALDLQMEPINIYLNGFPLYPRSASGISTRTGQAPYGVFKTSDGYLCLSMISLDLLAKIFSDETFLTWVLDGQFVRREEINELVAKWMLTNTTEYWMKRLDEFGAWYSVINDYDAVTKDPQVIWNEYFNEMDHPIAGKIKLMSHPVRYNGKTYKGTRAPALIGQHTEEILRELGYSDEQIRILEEKKVIRTNKK